MLAGAAAVAQVEGVDDPVLKQFKIVVGIPEQKPQLAGIDFNEAVLQDVDGADRGQDGGSYNSGCRDKQDPVIERVLFQVFQHLDRFLYWRGDLPISFLKIREK